MFETLLARLTGAGDSTIAIRRAPGLPPVTRNRLALDARRIAAAIGPAADHAGAWVSARDPYLMLVATLGALSAHSVALLEPTGPAAGYDQLAAVCPPDLVLCDDPEADLSRWAVSRGHRLLGVDPDAVRMPAGVTGRPDVALRFFTSGTTGPPKCIGIQEPQLVSAIEGVAARLGLTAADTSLSIAPLTHTLGMVTTVMAALASGGRVVFADPALPREFLATLADTRPTWCAAAPSGHRLVYRLHSRAGAGWPELRFLRSSAAPLPADLVRRLEGHYAVPMVNAYVMTEAPGEIASQPLHGQRHAGTVGEPSLCRVEIRSGGAPAPAGSAGEVWIRGPNVATGRSWVRTGDIGLFEDGALRITGRADDIINSGGLKIWPPDVEAVARLDAAVGTAVAFPIPHAGMGEVVGLAVVAGPGQSIDRSALRRRLMADLPRHAWPSTIVVCGDIPRSARGKIARRGLWRQLGVAARI